MANRVFDLEAVVSVLTGKAETSLNKLDDKARKSAAGLDELEDSANSVGDDLGGFAAKVDKASFSLGNLAKGVAIGNLIERGITSALEAAKSAVVGAGTAFVEFEAQIRNLNTITGLGEREIAAYAEQIRTMGRELGVNVGSAEAAAAAYDIASAGFTDAAENTAVMTASLKGASAGHVDAATSAALLAGSLRAYGADASEASKFLDIYFRTVDKGTTTFPELAATLGNVTSIASAAGVSIEELGASIATTTNRGIRTATAVDGIRGAITNLLAPTAQAQEELAKYGLTVNEQTLNQKGFIQTLIEIQQATGGSAESFKTILGDVQAFNVAIALTKDGGDLVKQNMEAMANATGAADGALREQAKSISFQFGQLKVAAEAAGVTIGSVFAGPVSDAIQHTTGLVTTVDNLLNSFRNAEGSLGGGLMEALQANLPATAAMFDQFLDTVRQLGDLVVDFLSKFTGESASGAKSLLDFLLSTFIRLATAVINIIGNVGEFVNAFVSGLQVITTGVGAAVGAIGTAWSSMVDGMRGLWENFMDKVNDLWVSIIDKILSAIQALPGQMRAAMEETEKALLQTRHALMTRDRPQASAGENIEKITSAPSIVKESVTEAIAGLNKPREPKPGSEEEFVGPPVPEGFQAPAATEAKAPATAAPTGPTAEDIESRMAALQREINLGKVSEQQAISRYQAILKAAQAAGLSAEETYKVEKELYDLQTSVTKKIEAEAKKRKAINDKIRVEYLKNVKGERDGLLEALRQEKEARAAAGADAMQLEAWYGSERQKIFENDRRKAQELERDRTEAANKMSDAAAKAEQESLAAQGKVLEAQLAGLQQQTTEAKRALEEQKNEYIKAGGDKLEAERQFQRAVLAEEQKFNAQRKKAIDDHAKEAQRSTVDLIADTIRNEAAVESDPQKSAKKTYEAENMERLQAIKDRVDAAREAGVSEVAIERYIASEKKKILDEANRQKEGGKEGQTSPVQSLKEAFSEGMFGSFSVGGSKSGSDPAAVKAANDLAQQVGQIGSGSTGNDLPALENVVTIRLVDAKGAEIGAGSASSSDAKSSRDMNFSYTPGRF